MGAVLLLLLNSCKKELSNQSAVSEIRFPTTSIEKLRVEAIKEVTSILKRIYKDPNVVYEVNSAIKSEYYTDERVLLRDLLTPDKSPVYKSKKFIESLSVKGTFKEAFIEELDKGNYPRLNAIMSNSANRTFRLTDDWPIIDTTNEIWTNEYGLSIYFPYSEDFPSINPHDPTNNTETGQLVTLVSADREADSGPGYEPYVSTGNPNEPMCPDNICYNNVTVDDAYAELHPVHIVGVGAEPNTANSPSGTTSVYIVYIGVIKCVKQYDRLISFTGNGGGSELRFTRGDIYLQPNTSGQITNFQNIITVNIKRKDIRKKNWKVVNNLWDSDWEIDNTEEIFGIYEEDTQGTKTFSGSLTSTLTNPPVGGNPGGTGQGQLGYSISVQTQDDIIRQLNWNRTSFYTYNQGGLNNGCGTLNGWTLYDCYSDVMYTMPTQ
ncbi:MAG: hypothetical protein JNK14_01460 [Chitinophagaceae bacterium]|nr:hypothetical protein [Chitinophagaceae bacterium]